MIAKVITCTPPSRPLCRPSCQFVFVSAFVCVCVRLSLCAYISLSLCVSFTVCMRLRVVSIEVVTACLFVCMFGFLCSDHVQFRMTILTSMTTVIQVMLLMATESLPRLTHPLYLVADCVLLHLCQRVLVVHDPQSRTAAAATPG